MADYGAVGGLLDRLLGKPLQPRNTTGRQRDTSAMPRTTDHERVEHVLGGGLVLGVGEWRRSLLSLSSPLQPLRDIGRPSNAPQIDDQRHAAVAHHRGPGVEADRSHQRAQQA